MKDLGEDDGDVYMQDGEKGEGAQEGEAGGEGGEEAPDDGRYDLDGNRWPEDVRRGDKVETGRSKALENTEYGALVTEDDDASDLYIYGEKVNKKTKEDEYAAKLARREKEMKKWKKALVSKDCELGAKTDSEDLDSDGEKKLTPSEEEDKMMEAGILDIGEHEYYPEFPIQFPENDEEKK